MATPRCIAVTHLSPTCGRPRERALAGAWWAGGQGSGAGGGDPLLSSPLAGAALCCLCPDPVSWINSSSPGFGGFFIEIESLCTKSAHRMDNLFWEEVIALLTRSSQLYLKPGSAGA